MYTLVFVGGTDLLFQILMHKNCFMSVLSAINQMYVLCLFIRFHIWLHFIKNFREIILKGEGWLKDIGKSQRSILSFQDHR